MVVLRWQQLQLDSMLVPLQPGLEVTSPPLD